MGWDGFYELSIKNVRPVEALITKLYIDSDISYENLYTIYVTISIILIVLGMSMLYMKLKYLLEKDKGKLNKGKHVLLIIIILCIFLNRFTMDNMIFFENLTMFLGIDLAILAAIIYTGKIKCKNIIAFILTTISVLSYQTMIIIFPIYAIIFQMMESKFKKISLKKVIKLYIYTFLELLIILLLSEINKKIGYETVDRTSGSKFAILFSAINSIACSIKCYIVHITIITMYVSYNYSKKNKINEFKTIIYNLIIVLCSIYLLNGAFALVNRGALSFRMLFLVGNIPGILGIFILTYIEENQINKKIVSIFTIFLIIEFMLYEYYTFEDIQNNKLTSQFKKDVKNKYEQLIGDGEKILEINYLYPEKSDDSEVNNDKLYFYHIIHYITENNHKTKAAYIAEFDYLNQVNTYESKLREKYFSHIDISIKENRFVIDENTLYVYM